jgi:hypothetical protein
MVKPKTMVANLRTATTSSSQRFMVTASQLRAARALLGWSRDELAKKSGVAAPTITDFELKGADARQGTVQKWVAALAKEGVEFTPDTDEAGCGVRWKKGWPRGKR